MPDNKIKSVSRISGNKRKIGSFPPVMPPHIKITNNRPKTVERITQTKYYIKDILNSHELDLVNNYYSEYYSRVYLEDNNDDEYDWFTDKSELLSRNKDVNSIRYLIIKFSNHINLNKYNYYNEIYEDLGYFLPKNIKSYLGVMREVNFDLYEPKTPNLERNPSPTVKMPKGDAPSLESKEDIQGGFTSAAEAKAFGEMFQRAREGEGKSQRATARESGIDPKNLRQIEHGITDPSLKTMRKIADSIGYKIELMLIPKGKE